MKSTILSAAVALMMLAAAGAGTDVMAQNQYNGGPGIVMAGSQNYSALPKDAQKFIEKHFKDVQVAKCEQYFAKHKYEVELANGVDIEFDNKGKVIEIDAPDNHCLAPSVVKETVHGGTYRRLEKDGLINNVEKVEYDKRGRVVEIELSIPDPDTYIFDISGNFIGIED